MSIHFHPLKIKEIRRRKLLIVFLFNLKYRKNLKRSFTYLQGQSLTMRAMINGEEVRRTYSLCSSPLDKEWKVAIKKVEGGLFSSFANDTFKKDDVLEVMEPVGKFYTKLNPANKKNYLAFAAGSGITPVLSIIIQTTLTNRTQQQYIYFGVW